MRGLKEIGRKKGNTQQMTARDGFKHPIKAAMVPLFATRATMSLQNEFDGIDRQIADVSVFIRTKCRPGQVEIRPMPDFHTVIVQPVRTLSQQNDLLAGEVRSHLNRTVGP